jgi:hypothetical protein
MRNFVVGFFLLCFGIAIANLSGPLRSQVVTSSQTTGQLGLPQGRLTLQSNTPVMVTSQSTKTSIFYDCYRGGGQVPYFNGSGDILDSIPTCEVSNAMQSSGTGVLNSGGVFDVWWEGNTNHNICVATNGSGGGWASDTGGSATARGTGYSQIDATTRPYLTNMNALTHCYNAAVDYGSIGANKATYLGTIYTNAAGTVSHTYGTLAGPPVGGLFGVWNMYNRVPVATYLGETVTYTYQSSTKRECHGDTTYQVDFVTGRQEDAVEAQMFGISESSASGDALTFGVGVDSTTAITGVFSTGQFTPSVFANVPSYYTGTFLGKHYVSCIEYMVTVVAAATVQNGANFQTGLTFKSLY